MAWQTWIYLEEPGALLLAGDMMLQLELEETAAGTCIKPQLSLRWRTPATISSLYLTHNGTRIGVVVVGAKEEEEEEDS
jgi:hypothetical protein